MTNIVSISLSLSLLTSSQKNKYIIKYRARINNPSDHHIWSNWFSPYKDATLYITKGGIRKEYMWHWDAPSSSRRMWYVVGDNVFFFFPVRTTKKARTGSLKESGTLQTSTWVWCVIGWTRIDEEEEVDAHTQKRRAKKKKEAGRWWW
jgi:hypothetical protein